MKVLVACEFSGRVREAFRMRGHNAWSCDIIPSDDASPFHIQKDIKDVAILNHGWDLMIAFPPCTHLASSGARWFPLKQAEQASAIEFVKMLMDAPILKIAIENPIGVISTKIRKPDQIVQPWMFGDEARKSTCLWLKNLPKLEPTNIVGEGEIHVTKSGRRLPKWYNIPPIEGRAKLRSVTFQGFANAMAAS